MAFRKTLPLLVHDQAVSQESARRDILEEACCFAEEQGSIEVKTEP